MSLKRLSTIALVLLLIFHHSSFVAEAAVEDIQDDTDEMTFEQEVSEDPIETDTEQDALVEDKDNSVQGEETVVQEESQEENHDQMENDEEAVKENIESNNSSNPIQTFSTTDVSMPFERGDRHEDIVEIKKKLNHIGFGGISETNLFGSWMETRVKQLQDYYGLDVTGKVDDQTLGKIDEVYDSPFQLGKRHEKIPELKEMLNSIGYGNITVTTLYGNFMDNRVRKFQKDYGLRVNGIVDEITLQKIKEIANKTTFKRGDRHVKIVEIKKKLNHIGFGGIKETELFGSWMETQVKQLQDYYGLDVTGKVDDQTLAKIDEVYNSPFQLGERHDEIPALKEKLNRIGYGHITVTTLYGSFMDNRVRKFQRDHGLRVNGIVDEVTLNKINELSRLTFEPGERHPNIVDIKKMLNRIGFDRISETTLFGSWMETRVKQLQDYYDLEVTGKVDEATYAKIAEVYNSPFQLGKRHDEIPALKEKLNRVGYGHITVSTLYGSFMDNRVRKFQRDYGLRVNGILDEVTLNKLNEEVSKTPFQRGDRHEDIVEIKKKLNHIGFDGISETTLFGSWMETRVKQLQRYYGLSVTGKLDDATLKKIDEVYYSPFQQGNRHEDIIELKEKMNAIGYGNITVTDLFGSFMDNRVRKLQSDYGLVVNGIIDEVTLMKINELYDRRTIKEYVTYNLTLEEALNIQMALTNPRPLTDEDYAYVSKAYVNSNNEVTAEVLNVRAGPGTAYNIIGTLSSGTKVTVLEDLGNNWYRIQYNSPAWVNASREDVLYYLDPLNFINHDQNRFQFLDLSRPSGASASLLNSYLEGKGILEGRGQDFIEASRTHGVNEVYLLSHALLETGNGTSRLANGVEVGKDRSGNLVLVTDSNRNNLTDIRTTYNMFGIGATDGNAVRNGAIRAYKEGWFTPKDAIIGGAKFIGNDYIKAGQNTLYKMRWNPASMANYGYASHQYASDIGWAVKQTINIYNLYQEIGITSLYLEIPRYR